MSSVLSRIGWRLVSAGKRAAIGGFAVAILTAACRTLNANFAVASFLYLLVIVLQSLAGNFLSSLFVAVVAAGCLDYYFIEPLYTFTVARGIDIVALLSFVTATLVITQLVLRARAEARAASLERGRLERLYELSRRLLAVRPPALRDMAFLQIFLGTFGATAICMFDAETARAFSAGLSRRGLPERTRDAYISGSDQDDPDAGVSMRLIQIGDTVTGAVGFESLEAPALTAGPLAMLAAAMLERARALQRASEAAAAAQAEVYRSAILDALAHEFKTPLATILAATGGLSEAGRLNPVQVEMAETVETEAARLGSLTSRLLRMARLDREDIKPRIETIDIGDIVASIAEQHSRRFPDRRFRFVATKPPVEANADPELLRLAISQVIENACKYSAPASAVTVALKEEADRIAIVVSNTGSSIAAADQQRIFDRYYRGDAGRVASGSGLGLYVARKIAVAHGGALELANAAGEAQDVVTFRLTLPMRGVETKQHVGIDDNATEASAG